MSISVAYLQHRCNAGAMNAPTDAITPATGRFLPVAAYDVIAGAMMRERQWRPRLADDLARRAGATPTVTEVGAGTGSLIAVLAARMPQAAITAVEPDVRARTIAAAKPGSSGVAWRDGRAEALPLADGSQDAVVMALMLHHLAPEAKRQALAEARRVLAPTGTLYVADFVRPQDPLMGLAFAVIQLADGRVSTRDHRAGRLPTFVVDAGFGLPEAVVRLRTAGGSFAVLRCPRG
jgi:ubiquinone/menaquinone biosynthesis C-methylase UbiE